VHRYLPTVIKSLSAELGVEYLGAEAGEGVVTDGVFLYAVLMVFGVENAVVGLLVIFQCGMLVEDFGFGASIVEDDGERFI